MAASYLFKSIMVIQAVASLALALDAIQPDVSAQISTPESAVEKAPVNQSPANAVAVNQINSGLEPRISDKNFVADILDRLHSLDSDIGKLLFNSSSMYAADDQSEAFRQNQPKGGERFTEVLSDLDSLQDEVGR